MGTMHGLALEFIHRFGEVIGLRPANVTVYGDWESGYLLADVAQEMSAKKPTIKAAKEALERYYQTGEEPKEEDPGHDLFTVFLARCRENNALTYGALLVGLRLLVPTLAKYLHVRHILVDEIQDMDRLQWSIVNEMTHAFKANLFVVGDVSQSIYEFRGAVPKYLVDHSEEFDIYSLESNYRSLPDIVEASNRLIEHNSMRLPLTMRATRIDQDSGVDNVIVMRDMDSEKIVVWRLDYSLLLSPSSPGNTPYSAKSTVSWRRPDPSHLYREDHGSDKQRAIPPFPLLPEIGRQPVRQFQLSAYPRHHRPISGGVWADQVGRRR